MSTPYGGTDPQQDPQQWGQQPYGDQTGGQQAGGVPAPGYGQPAQPGQEQWAQQPYGQPGQDQWGQQWQQYPAGYPQPGQEQWGQQQGAQQPYGQPQPGGTYPPSGPQPWAPPGQDQWGQQWQQQPYGAPYGQPGQPGGTFPPSGQPGGFGQYPPGMEPDQQKKSKAPLFIGIGVLVLLIGLIAVLGFFKPGFFFKDKVFDAAAVEQGVEQILTQEDVEFDAGSASCPADQPVEQDHTFTCTVTIDGEQKDVAITVVDAEADPPKYQVETP